MVFARSLARPASSLVAGAASPHLARRTIPTASAFGTSFSRSLTATASRQGKVLLVLYDVSLAHVPSKRDRANLFKRVTTTPDSSLACWELPRTSLVSENGLKIRATSSSLPLTKRAKAQSSINILLTPRLSSQLRTTRLAHEDFWH